MAEKDLESVKVILVSKTSEELVDNLKIVLDKDKEVYLEGDDGKKIENINSIKDINKLFYIS